MHTQSQAALSDVKVNLVDEDTPLRKAGGTPIMPKLESSALAVDEVDSDLSFTKKKHKKQKPKPVQIQDVVKKSIEVSKKEKEE